MAKTPTGDTGKTIQIMRTNQAYNSTDVVNEQLEYGEPLYNNNDHTVVIGDASGTSNDKLKVIKQLDRNKANSQMFTASTGNSTRENAGVANIYDESNQEIYPKTKQWDRITVGITNSTYNVDTSKSDFIGTQQSSVFASVPCVQKYTVANMKSTFTPSVSLAFANENMSNASTVKAMTKAFACISRVETCDGYITIIFNKKPTQNFYMQLSGG